MAHNMPDGSRSGRVRMGWTWALAALVATSMFVGLILVGYVYELKKKLLSWRTLE